MNNKIIVGIVLMLVSIGVLSGCTENTANISEFDRVESNDFILIYVTEYNEKALVDLIQSEYEKGNTYIDCISLDVTIAGRSDSMVLFQKGRGI